QSSRRAAVDRDIARQQEAIERWSVDAEGIVDSTVAPVDRGSTSFSQPTPHEARLALVAPSDDVRRVLGERPPSLSARDEWFRQAIRLVGQETPKLDVAPEPANMDDLGMEI
ncbi:MAG: conjugative relaxase, partial [Conexibacter sp.]|nr:conjugative relaxase [Conexibacter sp.]